MKILEKCKGCCGPVPQRFVTVIMAALGLSFVYFLRNSFSLALSKMVTEPIKNETLSNICPYPDEEKNTSKTPQKGEFPWNAHDKQYLISAYFVGYTLAHPPGGIMGDLIGAKVVLNGGLLLGGVCSLLSPLCARIHFWMLFFVRFLMGLGHGVIFPALATLVAKWSKPTERSLMSAITYSGIMFGSAGGISLTGLVLAYMPGWAPQFYIFGGMMLLWCTVFYVIGYSSPAYHPFITDKEQTEIEEAIQSKAKVKPKHIPWGKILTSKPVLSLILVNVGHTWLVYFVGVQLPIYIKNILHFNMKGSGASAALPYCGMWISGILTGLFSDWTIRRNLLSVTNNRKIFAILSNFLPVPFLIGASYAGCDKVLTTVFFTLMMTFKGMAYPSLKTNPVDLSPNYAGVLMGLANGLSAFGGLMIPYVVRLFVSKDGGDLKEWRTTFFFSSGVLILMTLPYAFFADGNEQPWNTVTQEEEERT